MQSHKQFDFKKGDMLPWSAQLQNTLESIQAKQLQMVATCSHHVHTQSLGIEF